MVYLGLLWTISNSPRKQTGVGNELMQELRQSSFHCLPGFLHHLNAWFAHARVADMGG